MFELIIDGTVYQFKFGIGFIKDMSKTAQRPVDGVPGKIEDVGLALTIGRVMDGDILGLIDVLFAANKGFTPRITKEKLEGYIENDETDIDALFKDVLDFFEKANATRKVTKNLQEAVAREKQKEMNL